MLIVHISLGSEMGFETQLQFVKDARRHNLVIIEDCAYAFLEPMPPACLAYMSPERTFHVGSFFRNLAELLPSLSSFRS